MKKSIKWIAALLAAMLAFAAVPALAANNTPYYASTLQLNAADQAVIADILAGKVVQLQNGQYYVESLKQTITPEAYSYYQFLIYNNLYQNPTYTAPAITYPINYWNPIYGNAPTMQNVQLTLNQFETAYIGANVGYVGTAYTYNSSDTSKVVVTQYGMVQALAPTEENKPVYVMASANGITYLVYEITVNAAEFSPSDYSISVMIVSPVVAVGSTTTVYAYLLHNGVRMYSDLKLNVVQDADVIELNGNTVLAKTAGSATITATVPGTTLAGSAVVTVVDTNKTVNPEYPVYPYYPNLPVPTAYSYYFSDPASGATGRWIFTSSSNPYPYSGTVYYPVNQQLPLYPQFPVNGQIPANYWQMYAGVDMSKYTFGYQMAYVNGSWQPVLVLMPKTESETETPAEQKPEEKPQETVPQGPTAEELAAKQQAELEAARQKALNAKIEQAKAGKIRWADVYKDLHLDSYYVTAVNFVLDNEYMTGKENGTFGTSDKMTFADVRTLFITYLELSEKDFDALGFFKDATMTKQITRQELAVLYFKLAQYLKLDTSARNALDNAEDYSELDAANADAFSWAVGAGVINRSALKIMAGGLVDRARLAQTLYNFASLRG